MEFNFSFKPGILSHPNELKKIDLFDTIKYKSYYNVSYSSHNSSASATKIIDNIDNNFPMYVHGATVSSAHAIVIRGYFNNAQIVYLWDGSYSTSADCKRSCYLSNMFSSQGVAYTWDKTLCKKW